MFWYGELNMMQDFLNLEFYGGWNIGGGTGGGDLPLGWTSTAATGTRLANGGVFGDAYHMAGRSNATITQTAFQNYLNTPLLKGGVSYDVRATIRLNVVSGTVGGKEFFVQINSPSVGLLGAFTVNFGSAPVSTSYITYIGTLGMMPATIPADTVLVI